MEKKEFSVHQDPQDAMVDAEAGQNATIDIERIEKVYR